VSSLTDQERLGLEDVFLSISKTPSKRYAKTSTLKQFLQILFETKKLQKHLNKPSYMIQSAKKRIKMSNISQYLAKKSKKKKNLS